MKLTGRQQAFLGKFLHLHRATQRPLHYTHVAKALGVGKVTAYDMLRKLEKRGLVRAEYVLRGERRRAGRSTVLFTPTPRAYALFPERAQEGWNEAEWQTATNEILDALQSRANYRNLLDQIVVRLPKRTTPLIYAAEMVTAVILNLVLMWDNTSPQALVKRLRALGLPGEAGLSALGGLAMGLSLAEQTNRHLADSLMGSIREYQRSLGRLQERGKHRLGLFVQEVMRVVSAHND
jgi:DNA-binding PadR family transcriptional regulator